MRVDITTGKRPIFKYTSRALLLVAALVYQVRYTMYRYPSWFGEQNVVAYPFVVLPDNKRPRLITYLIQPVPGISDKKPILEVDGKPLTGTAVFADALKHHRPGDLLQVT